MRKLDVSKATAPLGEYAKQVAREGVVLTRRGKPVAALFSVESADWETISLSTNPKFIAIIEESRARHKAEGGISLAEARRQLGVPDRRSAPKSVRGAKRRRSKRSKR